MALFFSWPRYSFFVFFNFKTRPPCFYRNFKTSPLGGIAPREALRTPRIKKFTGSSVIIFLSNYDLGSLPFQLLKISILEDSGIGLILYSGAGWCDISEESEKLLNEEYKITKKSPLIEAGLSLDGILGLLRIDFAWRLTHKVEENFFLSVGTSL